MAEPPEAPQRPTPRDVANKVKELFELLPNETVQVDGAPRKRPPFAIAWDGGKQEARFTEDMIRDIIRIRRLIWNTGWGGEPEKPNPGNWLRIYAWLKKKVPNMTPLCLAAWYIKAEEDWAHPERRAHNVLPMANPDYWGVYVHNVPPGQTHIDYWRAIVERLKKELDDAWSAWEKECKEQGKE